jgi:hypothetical protein
MMMNSGIAPDTKVYSILDPWIIDLKRSDFIMIKKYTVKAIYDQPRTKWSRAIKDAIFFDSKDFFKIYFKSFVENF